MEPFGFSGVSRNYQGAKSVKMNALQKSFAGTVLNQRTGTDVLLIGKRVYDRYGNRLGAYKGLHQYDDGAYAIISLGGFLAIGEDCRALPVHMLSYNEQAEAFETELNEEVLRQSPIHTCEDNWLDSEWCRRVSEYYDSVMAKPERLGH
jgi:hypothetical protein